ncbi:MAG: ACT domain-containing protein [Propionibacteriaceae bacterium]|nr:ACT domain-containing protein [Propionibacteriaceae bacterium]
MAGMTDLTEMLRNLDPVVRDGGFVYVVRPDDGFDSAEDMEWEWVEMEAETVIVEDEGRTLIVAEGLAADYELEFDGVFGWITLQVHSSLHAVGLTAAVSTALAGAGISCNMLAGFHHDHLLVPLDRLDDALAVIGSLAATR